MEHTAQEPTDRKIRVLSFDNALMVGGISTWSCRLAMSFKKFSHLGIDWTAVELGSEETCRQLARMYAETATSGVLTEIATSDDNAWTVARKLLRLQPSWAQAEVVVPNWSFTGWVLPKEIERQTGSRPHVLAAMHSDHVDDYAVVGEPGPGVIAGFGVSRRIQEEFSRRYPDHDHADFVPSGVPTAPTFVPRETTEPLKFVYCGRVVQQIKRVMDLVPLVDELNARNVDYELHVIGDGPELPELRNEMDRRSPDRVKFHGAVPATRVPELLAGMHVIVSLSELEGTSVSMLEAMGQGLAPVVTDVASGVRDVIVPEINGFIVPIFDMTAMAQVLSRLAGDRDLLARIAQAAWKRVTEKYSLEVSATEMAKTIRKLVASPKGKYIILPNHPLARSRRLDKPWLPGWLVKTARQLRRKMKTSKA